MPAGNLSAAWWELHVAGAGNPRRCGRYRRAADAGDQRWRLRTAAAGDRRAGGRAGRSDRAHGRRVEFYNAALDHYFITWIAAEIFNLDAGITPTRWTRTGKTFKAYATALSGTSQVCRLYIPPAVGDSHFFGRSSAECNASRQAHPEFVLEDASYMQVYMPTMGSCPAGSQPVYRLFNGRRDANHRYVTARGTRDQMVTAGWIAEGD